MRRELTAQVGADGVLTLTVPLDREDANKTVHVVVETVDKAGGAAVSQEEWKRFVERTAGVITDPTFVRHSQEKWQGDFERDQGEYEERDPL